LVGDAKTNSYEARPVVVAAFGAVDKLKGPGTCPDFRRQGDGCNYTFNNHDLFAPVMQAHCQDNPVAISLTK
jgi:hypothetical protein